MMKPTEQHRLMAGEMPARTEQEPSTFFSTRRPSPVGPIFLVWDEAERLHLLYFDAELSQIEAQLRRHHAGCALVEGPVPDAIAVPIDRYFEGDIAAIDRVEVSAAGSPFQREVWTALRTIPAGRTTSYGALAKQLGRPGASRAVGLANGSNPVSLVVPCHRVIGSDGSLTGYGGGLPRKQWLLDHERRFAGAEPQLGLFVG